MFGVMCITKTLVLTAVALMLVPSSSLFARGLGGARGGGVGGFGGGMGGGLSDRIGSAELGGGIGSGALTDRGGQLGGGGGFGGGLRSLEAQDPGLGARLGAGGGRLSDLDLSGAGLQGDRAAIANALQARGLGEGGLAGSGALSGLGQGGAPTRSQISNFLGLPSDNGLHNLSGETQSRLSQLYDKARSGDGTGGNILPGETQSKLSQLYDNIRAGDGPGKNFIPGETQKPLSRLYDDIRAGDRPFQNFIPGETQKPLSRLYDDIRAGDRPFQNFIPGETQKPLSRLYDYIRAGNHPFRPISPWIIHNNAVIIRRNFNNYFIFTPGWYRRYPAAWYPPVWVYGNPWICAPWPTLGVWLGCPPGQPVYYDYGTNVVYQDNSIYVNGQSVGTPDQYYQQAQELAAQGAGDSTDGQWMPLGVFAISQSGQKSANLILQLGVNKQGIIRGNMTNTNSNTNEVVHGAVNKQTERAAWTVGDDTSTVFETGIYNLTKDETPVIVHYGNDQTEQLLLVRLNQKDQDSAANGQTGALQ